MYDRYSEGQLVGNVAIVPGRQTTDAQGVPTWKFGDSVAGKPAANDPYHLLVRSARKKSPGARGGAMDAQIHLELNVVPVATPEDEVGADSSDPAARRKARQVDEVGLYSCRIQFTHSLKTRRVSTLEPEV